VFPRSGPPGYVIQIISILLPNKCTDEDRPEYARIKHTADQPRLNPDQDAEKHPANTGEMEKIAILIIYRQPGRYDAWVVFGVPRNNIVSNRSTRVKPPTIKVSSSVP
jgi:hypothetical protein